ncbi:hypothetical protein ACFWJT_04735 [Streptomyces sp. NPDC127069]|uniref:hypothetical protein n=1 Tax=Streptomyces sp. NPDC127069 TaxID=3347128 RepID=UPI0036535C84
MPGTAGLLAADVAKVITTVMAWKGDARTTWVGPAKERIEHPGDSRWIGVTTSMGHTGVSLHAGRTRDGVCLSPEAHSERLDGTDQAALALAVRRPWEQLNALEQKKSL